MASYQESAGGTTAPYNTGWETLFNTAQGLYGQQAGKTVPTLGTAGLTGLQTQAQGLAQSGLGNYQPWLDQAAQFSQQSGQGAQFDPAQLQQYFNPYQSGVVDEIARLGNERFTQDILPGLSNSFGGLGQFGSARQAAMMADAAGKSQREVLGQQAQALNTGYQNAMGNYKDWTQMGIGAQQQAGAQLGNLAQAQQQLSQGDIGALSGLGLTQQQTEQQRLQNQYQQQMQQMQYPWQNLDQWSNVFKAGTPQSSTSWNTAFKKGGLARFAGGGNFSEVAPEYSEDLIERMRAAGMSDEEILDMDPHYRASLPDLPGVEGAILPSDPMPDFMVAANRRAEAMPRRTIESVRSRDVAPDDLRSRAFDERVRLLDRARSVPELQAIPEGSMIGNIGEAMMRAGAQGPANIGQMIGRSGTAYFDKQNAVNEENKKRALARLTLEEKIVPDVGSAALGRLGSAGQGWDFKVTPEGLARVNKITGESEIAIKNDESNRLKFEKLGYEKAVAQGHPDPVAYGKAFADSVLSGGSVPSIGNSGQSTTLSQLPTKGQAEQQQGEGKAAAGTYENYVKDEAKAISDLDTISQVSYALENLKTNKLAPPINFVKSWAEAFGVPVDVEKLGAEQALNSIAGKMAVSMHQPGMGVMTDADLKFYQTLTPSLANTAEGNAKIIDAAKRLAERRLTISRMAQEYKESNPKGILDVGWRKVRDEYIQSNPLYPELVKAEKTKQTVKSFEALPDAKQYDGKRIKFPDGSIHRSVNGQWVKE